MRQTSELAAVLALGTLVLSGCGSGADGRPAPGTVPPTVTINASPQAVTAGQATTLTWSSTEAAACTASGGWTGARGTSGTEQIPAITATTTFTLACTGMGGTGTQSTTVTVNAPGAGDVIVSGKITFDRVPFKTPPATGLNPTAPVESPARQVVVEAIDAGNATTLASTTTDTNGDYALTVPANRSMFIRARAEMLKSDAAPTWDFSVRNNTNGDALYVLDGSAFDSGAGNSTRNLKAAIGWNGTAYTNRAAAPFAILDTIYQAKELVLDGDPAAELPGLVLFWSASNRPSAGPLCPDDGDIGTSFYITEGQQDGCTPPRTIPAGIYILGDFTAGDTDEFDQHVVAHEFGHYFEDQFSRSDSIGGSHGGGDRLDLRLAFGEGWGNAYAAMSLNNPAYRDSQQGASSEFGFNLESDSSIAEGWFSEFSVGEILFDVFDSAADGADNVALGFGPMYAVMVGPQVQTDALTSIFTFASALRAANGASAAGVDAVLSGEQIDAVDDFGSTENNDGGDDRVLPVYEDISLNTPVSVCSRATAGSGDTANKLGNRKFLRLVVNANVLVTIHAAGAVEGGGTIAATDPDIFVHRRGSLVDFGAEQGSTETISQLPLVAGTYIIEVYDFDVAGTNATPRCMQVSVQG
jgi:hypothetical protein